MNWTDTIHDPNDPENDEYGTPAELVRSLAEPLGGFDVDPASGAEPAPFAPLRYDEQDDGLTQPWDAADGSPANVWLNPPFSRKSEFVVKARNEVAAGRAETVVVLLPSDTSTDLFHGHITDAPALCLIDERVGFVGGDDSPNFAVLLAVYGTVPDALLDALDRRGTVYASDDRRQRNRQATLGGGE